MALVSGIEESKIIEIRNEHVYDEATRSVQKHGWLPGLFRGIIQKAKECLLYTSRAAACAGKQNGRAPRPSASLHGAGNTCGGKSAAACCAAHC